MINQIFNENCIDTISRIDDESIDLILTDPPYHTTNLEFDKTEIPKNLYSELKRILKSHGWFFCFGTIEMFMDILQAKWKRRFDYIWVKPRHAMQSYNATKPFSQHEQIMACIKPELTQMSKLYMDKKALETKGKPYNSIRKERTTSLYLQSENIIPRDNNGKPKGFIQNNTGQRVGTTILKAPTKNTMKYNERTPHPTQKPLSLLQTIIKGYCPKDGLVFDPFMGSGSTCLAAKLTSRNFIGSEISKTYFQISQNRLNSTLI